jgi:putative ABC transport system substrate-binding protein
LTWHSQPSRSDPLPDCWSLRNPFFTGNRTQIIVLAARYGWPAIHQWREFADAGGQASYGPSFFDSYRQAGLFAARILKW